MTGAQIITTSILLTNLTPYQHEIQFISIRVLVDRRYGHNQSEPDDGWLDAHLGTTICFTVSNANEFFAYNANESSNILP
jgi:hypothetical protein